MGCYNSFDPFVPSEADAPVPTSTIEHVHELYSKGTREVHSDISFEGYVTANDEYGNFYNCFVVENEGYAVEILDGLGYSHILFPLGSRVVVSLNGLGLDRYKDVLRVGLIPSASSLYNLDYMSSESIVDRYVSRVSGGNEITPIKRKIEELNESQSGSLIRLEGLQLCTEELIERTWSGYALFRDKELDSIWCYTSPYADFAKAKIPQEELSLSGILEFGNTDTETNQFMIRLRSEEDCVY